MVTIEEIRARLAERGDTWVAQETEWFRNRSNIQNPTAHLGLRMSPPSEETLLAASNLRTAPLVPLPQQIDWRNEGKVTAVRDQGTECGSCVAFAVCAALESDHWINTGVELDLSESHLFFCNGGTCEDGWDIPPALNAVRDRGVGLEADFPYQGQADCRQITPRIGLSRYMVHTTTESRKRAIARGPVVAAMQVFEDFQAYAGGIYKYVAGDLLGGHAVTVVGYNDHEQYWVVKNSWGPKFGESGFFRISYGECLMDTAFAFYSVESSVWQ